MRTGGQLPPDACGAEVAMSAAPSGFAFIHFPGSPGSQCGFLTAAGFAVIVFLVAVPGFRRTRSGGV